MCKLKQGNGSGRLTNRERDSGFRVFRVSIYLLEDGSTAGSWLDCGFGIDSGLACNSPSALSWTRADRSHLVHDIHEIYFYPTSDLG